MSAPVARCCVCDRAEQLPSDLMVFGGGRWYCVACTLPRIVQQLHTMTRAVFGPYAMRPPASDDQRELLRDYMRILRGFGFDNGGFGRSRCPIQRVGESDSDDSDATLQWEGDIHIMDVDENSVPNYPSEPMVLRRSLDAAHPDTFQDDDPDAASSATPSSMPGLVGSDDEPFRGDDSDSDCAPTAAPADDSPLLEQDGDDDSTASLCVHDTDSNAD